MVVSMNDESKVLQHLDTIKEKHGKCVVLFRNGDYYDCYREDARTVSDVLGITLCQRNGIDFAGFPHKALDMYLPKLVIKGNRVCIFDKEAI